MSGLLTRAAYWWIERDYERHAKRLAPELAELGIRHMEATPTGWEGTFVTPAAAEIANIMADMLNDADAENYLTFDFLPRLDRQVRPVRVTVQWANGLNPGLKAAALERQNAELRQRIAELEAHDE